MERNMKAATKQQRFLAILMGIAIVVILVIQILQDGRAI
jgi:hypothetical protein